MQKTRRVKVRKEKKMLQKGRKSSVKHCMVVTSCGARVKNDKKNRCSFWLLMHNIAMWAFSQEASCFELVEMVSW